MPNRNQMEDNNAPNYKQPRRKWNTESPMCTLCSSGEAVVMFLDQKKHNFSLQLWLRGRACCPLIGTAVVQSPAPFSLHVEMTLGKLLNLKLLPKAVPSVCK